MNSYKQLTYQTTIFDDEDNKEQIVVTKRLLKHCGNISLTYDYDDIHFYVFNKKIYSLLEDEKIKNLSLIKSDLIPYLIKHHMSKRLKELVYTPDVNEAEEGGMGLKKKIPNLKIRGLFLENKNYA